MSCLENADILEEEEQLLIQNAVDHQHKSSDSEDKINENRRQVFALFKFAAELVYTGFIETHAIVDVISTLITNGY